MNDQTMNNHEKNQLLARVASRDWDRLQPATKLVPLDMGRILHESEAPLECAYFPTAGVLSAVAVMNDGDAIEVATVGREGMLGMPAFVEQETAPFRVTVQAPGEALCVGMDALKDELQRSAGLRELVQRYQAALLKQVSQSVACNGLHSIEQRCCRWLLTMRDRLGSDELPLTHEFLALMLGVRRASVTDVLKPLKEQGLIQARRGAVIVTDPHGLQEASCECYAAVRDEFERLLGGDR